MALEIDEINVGGNPIGKWCPPPLTLGALVGNGAGIVLATGAGYYYNFDNVSDDEVVLNVALRNNEIDYDGSTIELQIFNMLFGVPVALDEVEWEMDYAFITDGDNAYTKLDGTAINTVVVDARTSQIRYTDSIPATLGISGTAGDDTLQITLRRNSQGAGSDSYAGNVEIYGLQLIKI